MCGQQDAPGESAGSAGEDEDDDVGIWRAQLILFEKTVIDGANDPNHRGSQAEGIFLQPLISFVNRQYTVDSSGGGGLLRK